MHLLTTGMRIFRESSDFKVFNGDCSVPCNYKAKAQEYIETQLSFIPPSPHYISFLTHLINNISELPVSRGDCERGRVPAAASSSSRGVSVAQLAGAAAAAGGHTDGDATLHDARPAAAAQRSR